MSAFSDYLEPKILNAIFNNTAMSIGNTLYVALYTVVETDAGGGTEVSGGAYARKPIYSSGVTNTPKWNNAATDAPGFVVDNANTITFPTATSAWGDVKGTAIWDHLTTGNLIMHGALAATKTIGASDVFKFLPGSLNMRAE